MGDRMLASRSGPFAAFDLDGYDSNVRQFRAKTVGGV